jgi:1,4-alpha-glucan branching enzyme
MPQTSGTSGPCAADPGALDALVRGEHGDPFALLGPHQGADGRWWIRAFLPGARVVAAVDARGERVLTVLEPERAAGLFAAVVPRVRRPFAYRLRVQWNDADLPILVDDPYRFAPVLGELDLWLLAEGTDHHPYDKLGAHGRRIDGCDGTAFAVWAPHARRVSVVGDWNFWDERRHPMRLRPEGGIWEIFLPGVAPGARYKFALLDAHGQRGTWRADPYARESELRPATASVVAAPLPAPRPHAKRPTHAAPMAIYEVHLPSWRRVVE